MVWSIPLLTNFHHSSQSLSLPHSFTIAIPLRSFSTQLNSPSTTVPATTYGFPNNNNNNIHPTTHTGGDIASTTAVPYMQPFNPHINHQQHLQMMRAPLFQQQIQQNWQNRQQILLGNQAPPQTAQQQQQQQEANQAAPDGDANAGAPAANAAAQRFPNVVQDEVENHDWLDLFYATSRLLVLVALVYFYSSPLRCLIVIFFIILYYL